MARRCAHAEASRSQTLLPCRSPEFSVLETRKDGTKFTSRRLKRAAEQLQALEAEYQTHQKALVEQVRKREGNGVRIGARRMRILWWSR